MVVGNPVVPKSHFPQLVAIPIVIQLCSLMKVMGQALVCKFQADQMCSESPRNSY